jgi:hypothetical protein
MTEDAVVTPHRIAAGSILEHISQFASHRRIRCETKCAGLVNIGVSDSLLKLRENGVGWRTAVCADWNYVHATGIQKSDWLIARTRSGDAGGINRGSDCCRNVTAHELFRVWRALFQQQSRKRRSCNQRFRREIQSAEGSSAL